MPFTRRDFLKLAGGSAGGAAILAACRPGVREFIEQSPARLPEDQATGTDNWYATTCRQCGAGCGIVVRLVEGRAKKIEGNPKHPVNMGKTCARGQSSVQAVYHPDRIRRPMKATGPRGSGAFREISWEEALNTLRDNLKALQGQAGAVSIVTDPSGGHLGGLLQEFARAQSAVFTQYEPLEHSTLREAVKRAFGQDRIPDFDIKNAAQVFSFGADFLGGWVSQVRHSRAYGAFRQGDRVRGTLVSIDARFSSTSASADSWVPVTPGAEGKLALAMAHVIISENLGNARAAAALTGGRGAAALDAFAPDRVASVTGVTTARIRELAHAFADRAHQPAIALGGGSAGAHTNGVFNLTAIYALNHLVGSVGVRGGVIANPESPLTSLPGSVSVRLLPKAGGAPYTAWKTEVDRIRGGAVKTLLIRNANPVWGSPAALDVAGAFSRAGFIASFSSFLDDTTYMADLVLPTNLPLEDWGDMPLDPAPGIEAVGFQQPVVRPFYETRGFGDLLLTLSQELGYERQIPWTTFRDLLRDGAQRLYQLRRGSINAATFEGFWNELLRAGGWWDETRTAASQGAVPQLDLTGADAQTGDAAAYPYALLPFESISLGNGQLAHLPWMQAIPDPITTTTWDTWVEVNMKLAEEQGLKEGDIVRLESPSGAIEAAVYPNPATPPGVLGVPIGQGHKAFGRWAQGRGSNPLAILEPRVDAKTGSLAWAATRVKLVPTGNRRRIPKMENSVFAVDFTKEIAQVTPKD